MLSEVVHLTIFRCHVEQSGQRVAAFEIVQDAILD